MDVTISPVLETVLLSYLGLGSMQFILRRACRLEKSDCVVRTVRRYLGRDSLITRIGGLLRFPTYNRPGPLRARTYYVTYYVVVEMARAKYLFCD